MGLRPRLIAAITCTVLATACTGGDPQSGGGPGPLSGWDATGWAINEPEGSSFGNGWLVLENDGPAPIRLREVTTDRSPGLALLGTAIGPTNNGIVQKLPWPLSKPFTPLENAVIQPGEKVQVVIGYLVKMPGRSTVREVTVDYEVEGEERSLSLVNTLAVCTTSGTSCQQEKGALSEGSSE